MPILKIILKAKDRLWKETVKIARDSGIYPKLYSSYWHFILRNAGATSSQNHINFYTGVPNRGAGIGHQLSNWIAGYWWAKQFNLRYAHTPFSTKKWESFLGLGEGEVLASDLIDHQGYKKVLLPMFNEYKQSEVDLNMAIISSYAQEKVVFVAEQDQPYQSLFGIIEDLRSKFYSAAARADEKLVFSKDNFNVAIQIRRGDISIGQTNLNPNLQMRWQDNSYFQSLLIRVLERIHTQKPVAIYLFSQGIPEDFTEFQGFQNLHLCLEMSAQDSFLHMVFSDLLITSKSSFSYKPALLNRGIKVCPRNFWHNYPDTHDWVLVDDDGNFDVEQLNITL